MPHRRRTLVGPPDTFGLRLDVVPVDSLRVTLTLALGERSVVIAAGGITRVSVRATAHDFEADVAFRVALDTDEDPVFEGFVGALPLTATLSVASCLLDGTDEQARPMVLRGVVVDRVFSEQPSEDLEGAPVVGRSYRVTITDPARAYWSTHRPVELTAATTMKDVLERHKAPGMTLVHDWGALTEKHAMLCVAAGADGPAAFLDFVWWFVDARGGVIEHDAATNTYRFGGEKTRPSTPAPLEREQVARVRLAPPRPPRHGVRVRNASSISPATTPVANARAASGVWVDPLVRHDAPTTVERRAKLEADRLRAPGHELTVTFARCPPHLHEPGAFFTAGPEWSDKLRWVGKPHRLVRVELTARSAPPEGEAASEVEVASDDETASYEVELVWGLELASSVERRPPPYVEPRYPVEVEGKVVSVAGDDDDRTWMALSSDDGSVYDVAVRVPLWNTQVTCALRPGDAPGHWFSPPYKAQRALVRLWFDRAELAGFLDWAAGARGPQAAQGERVVMGMRGDDGAVIEHEYVDAKPAFTIGRAFGNDLQSIEVTEGQVRIEVLEDASKQEVTPRFDLSVLVAANKAKVEAEVDGAIEDLSGSFEQSMGATTAKLDLAIEDLGGALDEAAGRVVTKAEQIDAQLAELSGALQAAMGEVSDAVAAARAELLALLA